MRLTDDPQLSDLSFEEQRAFARTIQCPSCGRGPGRPCLGMNGNREPVELSYVHQRRYSAAEGPYRLHAVRTKQK